MSSATSHEMTEKQHATDVHLVHVVPVIDSTFSWADVKYGVGTNAKEKEILKGISGSLGGGKTCAIIGPSGAGKTSLLNVLANRINAKGKAQRVSGTIQLDGKPIGGAALRKRIAPRATQTLAPPRHRAGCACHLQRRVSRAHVPPRQAYRHFTTAGGWTGPGSCSWGTRMLNTISTRISARASAMYGKRPL